MAALKLNVLHWHLSEFGGYRLESKAHPSLNSVDNKGDPLYYTRAEVKAVVAYASDRGAYPSSFCSS
jgi:hexosaminidase